MITAFIISVITPYVGLKAPAIAKGILYLGIPIILIVALLISGFFLRGCWIDRKVVITKQAIDKLKVEEKKIEAKANADYDNSERKEVKAEVAEKKSDAFVEAAKKIQKETGVPLDEAKKAMCDAYPEACK